VRRLLTVVCGLGLALGLSTVARAQEAARPWIGIALEPGAAGARIVKVIPGTPGERAGLAEGDEVTAIDGEALKLPGELVEKIGRRGVGQVVALTVIRGGKRREAKLALDPRPDQLDLLRGALVGKKAPPFTLVGAGPHPARLEALLGKVVVLEFWATWCEPCNTTLPRLSRWQERYGKLGLRVIGVSMEPMDVVLRHLGGKRVAYTLASDPGGAVSDAYGVPVVPMFVVIDGAGVVRHVDVGAGSRVDAVEAAFRPLLGR
jgi:cytochrome c biogenesis protein CcmG, thiol:disulfide interchange protein DsbE